MKNLFKNLMLVAVAAMAFTACSQDVNEVNKVEKVTRYEFTANIADDTRSGFAEKEEGATAYKSEWYGNETLKVFVTDYNNYNVETTASINAKGQFALELTDAPESFFVTVVSPAEAWVSEYTANLPEVQVSGVNSVDPKAHLLQAQAVPVSRDSANAINMTHQIAYGKMTVKGVAFAIDHVVVDLKGSFYGYDREYSYTVKANGVDNTFWFATEPIDVAEFTVTAYDAEGKAVTKTVDVAEAGKTMSFQYGRVGTFSVSGLEKPAEKFDSTYAYVYQNYGDTDKEIMFVAEDGRGLRIDFYNVYENNCIVPGTYTFSGSGFMYANWCYYYANVNDYYTSKLDGGQAVVSVEDGQYRIVFTNMALGGTIYVDSFTFKGAIEGLDIPDPRAKLATPELSYTNEDKVVTLSWNAIEGVEYYSVECDSDAIADFTTTETSATITLPEYGAYNFSVTAKVADNSENYRSSDAATVTVVVKDPNAWADYEMTSVAMSGSYITMTDANDNRVTVFFNSADRIGNGIKLGNYSYIYSETPAVGQFGVYVVAYDGTYKWSYQIGSGSMSVEEVNGEYKILITVDGIRFGYIGTEALGAPITGPTIIASTDAVEFGQTGGSKSVDLTLANLTEDITVTSTNEHFTATVSGNVLTVVAPENTVEAVQEATITLSANGVTATIAVSQEAYNPNAAVEDGTEANPYIFKSASYGNWVWTFADASNGDRVLMDCSSPQVVGWFNDNGYGDWIRMTKLLYGTGASIYGYKGTDYVNSAFWNNSYIKGVANGDGTYTLTFKMSVDGVTYTYYQYVGTF